MFSPGQRAMISVREAVDLAAGVSIDDVNGILTGSYKNLRVGVNVHRDNQLSFFDSTGKLLTWY